jgi:serine/threonine-protein kinase
MGGSGIDQMHGTLLLALDRPRATVEAAFQRTWEALGDLRAMGEPQDRTTMALADGDLDAAAKYAERLLEASRTGSTHNEVYHWGAVGALAVLGRETDTSKKRASMILDELKSAKAWEDDAPHYLNESVVVAADLRAAGVATDADVASALERFRARYADVLAAHHTLAWAVECAAATDVPTARAAAEHEPSVVAQGELLNFEEGRAFIGIALARAGQHARAVPWLRRAASSCRGWSMKRYVDAHRWLGESLEATGDVKGACDAYGFVVRRWGTAKPRSVTAERAKERARALRCEPPKPGF